MSKQLLIGGVILLATTGLYAQDTPDPATQPAATQPATAPADHGKTFRITPAASRVLLSVMQARNLDFNVHVVRISAEKDPDGKVTYRLDITDQVQENDLTIIASPLRFVIDRAHIPLLQGVTIDYRKGPAGEGFVFVPSESATEQSEEE